jgi:hypothetical protein
VLEQQCAAFRVTCDRTLDTSLFISVYFVVAPLLKKCRNRAAVFLSPKLNPTGVGAHFSGSIQLKPPKPQVAGSIPVPPAPRNVEMKRSRRNIGEAALLQFEATAAKTAAKRKTPVLPHAPQLLSKCLGNQEVP